MKIYKTHRRSHLPWLFGLVLFALVMSITTSEVYGFTNTPKSNQNNTQQNGNNNGTGNDNRTSGRHDNDRNRDNRNGGRDGRDHRGGKGQDDNPPQVPEPATMILLGSGLVAAYVMKKKNSNKE